MKLYTSDTQSGCFDQIIHALKSRKVSLAVQHIIIVPDRFTLQTETELYKRLGVPGSFDIDVTTFNRLFSKLCTGAAYLSTNAAAMAVERILTENRERFRCFTKKQRSTGLSRKILNTIVNLKGCTVAPEKLKIDGNDNYANKFHDLEIIYTEYEKFLQSGKYADFSDKLTLLARAIPESEYASNAYFYLCNFDTVSAQTINILKQLDKYSLGAAAAVTRHVNPAFDNTQYYKLSTVFPGCEEYAEDKSKTTAAAHILANIFDYPAKLLAADNITVYESPYDGAMTDKIIRLISEKISEGYRYRDIAVVGNVPETEAGRIAEYGIPVNYERKLKLMSHPIIRLLTDALAAIGNGFRIHSILAIIKNPLFGIDRSLAAMYENFCLKYNIAGGIKPFVPRTEDVDLHALEAYEAVRTIIADKMGALSSKTSQAKTARDYTAAMRDFMEDNQISRRTCDFNARVASEYRSYSEQAEEKLNKILSEIEFMFDTCAYTPSDFLSVFIAGAEAEDISVIPPLCDAVYIAPPRAYCLTKFPVIIFYGMNDGVLPVVESDDGIITDANIDELNKSGIEIEPKSKQVSARNRHELIMTAALGRELYFLYAGRGRDGAELKKSIVLTAVENIFTGVIYNGTLTEEREAATDIALSDRETAQLVNRMFSNPRMSANLAARFAEQGGSAIISSLAKVYPPKAAVTEGSLEPDIAVKLFFYREKTSISRLERYFACPYKNFLESGLKLRERDDGKIKAIGVGNILHEVAQRLMTDMPATEELSKAHSAQHLLDILNSLYLDDTSGTAAMITKLRTEACALARALFLQSKSSNFAPAALEAEFEDGGKYPPIPLENGIIISGKIDRVDTFEGYAAVIDYKTGADIGISATNFICGDVIQLPIYMQALKMRGYSPAGLLYFPIRNEYVSEKKTRFKMYGLIADEPYVYQNLDKSLQPGDHSVFLPLTLTQKGIPSKVGNSIQTPAVMDGICEYTSKLCSRAAQEIGGGFIEKMPSQLHNPCQYCLANKLCGYTDEEFLQVQRADFEYSDILVREDNEVG